MALTSIGDLSRSLILRQANVATKSELTARTRELTTGLRNDIPAALKGDTRHLSQIESRLSVLAAYGQNGTELGHRTSSMQRSLEALQSVAQSLGGNLIQAGTIPSHTSLNAATAQAHQQLADVIGQINTETGGRYLFGGTRIDSAPLASADSLLTAARAAIGGATTAEDMIAAVTAFFDSPAGSGGFADTVYQGAATAQIAAVAPGQTVAIDTNATAPALREMLKGMTLMALSTEAPWSGDMQMQAKVVTAAGEALLGADGGLALLRGDLGATESAIARAQTRNSAESGALGLARNDLVLADQYEAASAVAEAEARLEAIYSLTARLSKLSLASYL